MEQRKNCDCRDINTICRASEEPRQVNVLRAAEVAGVISMLYM